MKNYSVQNQKIIKMLNDIMEIWLNPPILNNSDTKRSKSSKKISMQEVAESNTWKTRGNQRGWEALTWNELIVRVLPDSLQDLIQFPPLISSSMHSLSSSIIKFLFGKK